MFFKRTGDFCLAKRKSHDTVYEQQRATELKKMSSHIFCRYENVLKAPWTPGEKRSFVYREEFDAKDEAIANAADHISGEFDGPYEYTIAVTAEEVEVRIDLTKEAEALLRERAADMRALRELRSNYYASVL
jgi:hypothetical protein